MYRAPEDRHPEYKLALAKLLRNKTGQPATTITAGDPNNDGWNATFQNWLDLNGLRELADPTSPAFRSGTADDTIIMAARAFLLEGAFPDEKDFAREAGLQESVPVFVAEDGVPGENSALCLDIGTMWPDIGSGRLKFNVLSLPSKNWEETKNNILRNSRQIIL